MPLYKSTLTWYSRGMDNDAHDLTKCTFELGSGIALEIYDLQDGANGTTNVNLAPPYNHATLDGTAPADYMNLAVRILKYALSDDSGDWIDWDETNARNIERCRRALEALEDPSTEPRE